MWQFKSDAVCGPALMKPTKLPLAKMIWVSACVCTLCPVIRQISESSKSPKVTMLEDGALIPTADVCNQYCAAWATKDQRSSGSEFFKGKYPVFFFYPAVWTCCIQTLKRNCSQVQEISAISGLLSLTSALKILKPLFTLNTINVKSTFRCVSWASGTAIWVASFKLLASTYKDVTFWALLPQRLILRRRGPVTTCIES